MQLFLFVTLFLLLFTLPIPGTVALRHGLMVLLLLGNLFFFRQQIIQAIRRSPLTKQLYYGFTGISVWLVLQAAIVAPDNSWVWGEIQGQWFKAGLFLFLGTCFALHSQTPRTNETYQPSKLMKTNKAQGIITLLVGILSLQMLFTLLVGAFYLCKDGIFPQARTLFSAGKLEASYWNNILLAFLLIDLYARKFKQVASSYFPIPLLWGIAFLTILSNLAFGARNGVIGLVFLIISLGFLVLWHERKSLGKYGFWWASLGFFSITVIVITSSYLLDPRWRTFEETAKIAWDIDASSAWLARKADSEAPRLANGNVVDISAYDRISWIRAGLRLISEHPMGVGYGRNAFGHALQQHYGKGAGHSHSGWIDWTVGTGLPGLVLFLGLLIWSIAQGLRYYFIQGQVLGLVLTLLASGFLSRMLVDSINRDHLLFLFFFLLGLVVHLLASGSALKEATPSIAHHENPHHSPR